LNPLIKVIENSETGSVLNENAWQTISLIFSDDPKGGVALMKEAAAISSTPVGKQRLLDAAGNIQKYVK
jgi:hypothetical protein